MNTTEQKGWISKLATTGYASKGIVYGAVGVLAAMAAFGTGGSVEGPKGALSEIGSTAWGGILLVLIGVGLLAYGIYRLLGAFADIHSEGQDGSGIAKRLGYFGSGLVHCGLAAYALMGVGGSGSGTEESLTAKALSMPGGALLVGAVGLGIIGAGIYQWVKALTGKYANRFTLDRYTATKRKWIERIAKMGLIARGVIFPLIGFFLIVAATNSDPSQTKGMGEALQTLSGWESGPWLLGLTAIGLVCYGIYCEVLAIYGRWRHSAVR
ncbi:conserved hypothetical protein [Haloferula helveola]|uniref:DUF1206 domain-containing protein n=1 Tax=Haloferula helveola TaxID=490095 RepID=A0ABM7RBE9_9BACT|nr:conserved hypothetical protein [Haloferula helveola]